MNTVKPQVDKGGLTILDAEKAAIYHGRRKTHWCKTHHGADANPHLREQCERGEGCVAWCGRDISHLSFLPSGTPVESEELPCAQCGEMMP